MTPITSPLRDRTGAPLAGPGGAPLVADRDGIVYTLQGDDPVAVGTVVLLPDGRTVLAAMPTPGMAGLGESWWVRNRQLIGGIAGGAAGAGLVASAATPGTGFNRLIGQGTDAARQFFLPSAPAAQAAPVPAPVLAPVSAPATQAAMVYQQATPVSSGQVADAAPRPQPWAITAMPPATATYDGGMQPGPIIVPAGMPAPAKAMPWGLLGLGALVLGALVFMPRKAA